MKWEKKKYNLEMKKEMKAIRTMKEEERRKYMMKEILCRYNEKRKYEENGWNNEENMRSVMSKLMCLKRKMKNMKYDLNNMRKKESAAMKVSNVNENEEMNVNEEMWIMKRMKISISRNEINRRKKINEKERKWKYSAS